MDALWPMRNGHENVVNSYPEIKKMQNVFFLPEYQKKLLL
jgi:hypothetical protein